MRNHFTIEMLSLPEHLRPKIRISPFTQFSFNEWFHTLPKSTVEPIPEKWLNNASYYQIFETGRRALRHALIECGVNKGDSVLILTTSGGDYISSCVTDTIENFCGWSRTLEDTTQAILVIHEFGFPYDIPEQYLDLGVKIIEDCAYGMGTRLSGGVIGTVGDYAIYSLPKYAPIPFGGLFVSKMPSKTVCVDTPNLHVKNREIVKQCLSFAETMHDQWEIKRRENWQYFSAKIPTSLAKPYFKLTPDVSPGVFLLKLAQDGHGDKIKTRCNLAGIEATEYYGQNGFFFPIHQDLNEYEKAYILHHFIG